MTGARRIVLGLLLVCTLGAGLPVAASAGTFKIKTLHFDTVVGPNDDQHCDVIADLYRPAGVNRAHPAPAILTTNGFGGSKDDQAAPAADAASNGYVVLSYSGLGFGGSGCKIQLDDPDWDGKAGSQLVSFLGGSKTAKDGTKVDYVVRDAVAHDGSSRPDDPRVGMLGGSYGGQIQYAIAGIDPRLDTIIPIITWNDLSYALSPNNTSLKYGVTSATPGVLKYQWAALFTTLGIADGIGGISADPSRITPCPNFDAKVCSALTSVGTGTFDKDSVKFLRHASVKSYMDRIRIPTLLAQGQGDTLFNLQEAVATYKALRARGVEAKLVWQSWGHSRGTAAPGEWGGRHPLLKTFEGKLFMQWFDHYLKGSAPLPFPDQHFLYYRDWVPNNGDAEPTYAKAFDYPVGHGRTLYLSGTDSLTGTASKVQAGAAALLTPPAGAPTSITEVSALSQSVPLFDAPGTFATYSGKPLSKDTAVAGIPTARVRVSAPLAPVGNAVGAPGELTLIFKLFDVAPDGTQMLPSRLISPVRVADPTKPISVKLPGIVHKFAKGHRIVLTIAASDSSYRTGTTPQPVTVLTDAQQPGVLSVPVL